MCFYNDDYDWYAAITEETQPVAQKNLHCDECGRVILAGETFYHVHQQEIEECRRCEESECSCVDWDAIDADYGHECKCESPDFGESCEYDCCADCRKFLEGVASAEKEAGCPAHSRQPSLFAMVDEIQQQGDDEAKKYFEHAERLHPELQTSGYLPKLWTRMFGDDD